MGLESGSTPALMHMRSILRGSMDYGRLTSLKLQRHPASNRRMAPGSPKSVAPHAWPRFLCACAR
eukprot:3516078-Amphidinium_carterae.1